METLRKYWAQITFGLFVVVGGAVLHTEFKTSQSTQEGILMELSNLREDMKTSIQNAVETLNEEDDGVRSDFETSDKNIREYEELRAEKDYYRLLYEIEKSKE